MPNSTAKDRTGAEPFGAIPLPLIAIILVTGGVRLATLWIGRPEFSGWFNHVYYYYVQVRGLLDSGALPYPDMPLLFYIDAAAASLLRVIGMPLDSAVTAATHLVMCLVAAALPIPFHAMARELNGGKPLRRAQWGLVALSGFLPLTVVHVPEMFQKNMVGLVLLASLQLTSLRLLKHRGVGHALRCGAVALLVPLTHFGTTAALILFAGALIMASAAVRRDWRWLAPAFGISAGGAALAGSIIRVVDPQRFDRLLHYLHDAVASMGLFVETAGKAVVTGAIIVAVLAVVAILLRGIGVRLRSRLSDAETTFLLTNAVFAGALILPVWDPSLTARFILFLGLPLFVALFHFERDVLRRSWARAVTVAAAALLLSAMALGEIVSARMHNANHRSVYADLRTMRDEWDFRPDDLIVARTGVEHLANWFFGTRAGVLTTLSQTDFSNRGRVFVLNPRDGLATSKPGLVRDEVDAYRVMRSNVPLPENLRPVFETDNLQLFELTEPPSEWRFDENGIWKGYIVGDPPNRFKVEHSLR